MAYSFVAAMDAAKILVDETDKIWHVCQYIGFDGPYILLSYSPPSTRGAVHPTACLCESCIRFKERRNRA